MIALTKPLSLLWFILAFASPAWAVFPKPGDWKPLVPSPSPNYMNCVAYGDGLWVAVGDFGAIATSTDGVNWTHRESSAPKDWGVDQITGFEITSVAFGNGKWVACGEGGLVYTSSNGTEWSHHLAYEAEHNFFEEIVYAEGLWVMTGTYTGVLTSSDGDSWVQRSIDQANWIWALAYGNGQWVCVDTGGKLYSSTDAGSWRLQGTVPVDNNQWIEDIHHADGQWIAVSDKPSTTGSGKIFSSTDLESWTLREEVPLHKLLSVSHANGLWIACGGANGIADAIADSGYEGGVMLTSPDGITWTERPIARSTINWEVAHGNGRWLAASSSHGGLAYSDNGINWHSHQAHSIDTLPLILDADYHDGMWVASQTEGTILQSTDGKHWISRVLDDRELSDWFQVVHYSETFGKWYVGGDFGRLYTSDDGVVWERVSIGIRGVEGIAEGNGKILCVGRSWDVYESTNGMTWAEADHPQKGVAEGRYKAVSYQNGTWALCGSAGTVVYSTDDGDSWSKSTIPGGDRLNDIHFANGLWVACDRRGDIFSSTNLGSWTKASLPSRNHPRIGSNVDYIDSTWVFTGLTEWTDGHVFTSSDGKNWNLQPPTVYPGGAIEEIIKVDDDWYAFGRTMLGVGFVMSTTDFPAEDSTDRSLIFSDSASYTVTDTNEPEQFTSLPMAETLGGGEETLYVSFQIKRESGFGPLLDFTALQLSRSATHLPMKDDLGFGNGGPTTFYGIIVEPLHTSWPDTQIPLDNDTHTIIARIDYAAGTVSMVTDPQSASDIESARRHPAPTNPFSTIMLRAGHNDTSYTYSRIALGESAEAVLAFTEQASPGVPNSELDPINFREWEWKKPVLTSEDINDVAYGGGRYVAVTDHAHILWSDDGLAWQHALELPAPDGDLHSVAYGGGRWVAMGVGRDYTSTDGVHWEAIAGSEGRGILDVAVHSTRWVAVGDGVFTSRNGTVWEEVPNVTEAFLNGVDYGNGLWVIASTQGEIHSSPDGVTWTERRPAPTERDWIQRVRYLDGYWMLPGADRILTSRDGINWTSRIASDPDTVTQLYDVLKTADGKWQAVGWASTTTSDPENWPAMETPDSTVRSSVRGPDGRVIMVGEFGFLESLKEESTFVVGPGERTDTTADIVSAAYGNGIWLAASDSDRGGSHLWRSTTGGNYTNVRLPVAGMRVSSLSYGDGEFLVAGEQGAVRIFSSSDGLTWEEQSIAEFLPAALLDGHQAGGQSVFVGFGGNIYHRSSGSPEAFTSAATGTISHLNAVTFGNGTWVAVGLDGTIISTTSPESWEVQDLVPAIRKSFRDVFFANGLFVAVGDDSTIRTSIDGVTWEDPVAREGDVDFVAVTFHEARQQWYAADDSGNLFGSDDGSDWKYAVNLTDKGAAGMLYADGQLIVYGADGSIIAHGTPTIDSTPAPRLTGFEKWMETNNIADPMANVNGRTALESYVLATDLGTPSNRPDPFVNDELTAYLAIVRRDLEGILVEAEYSVDLVNWTDLSKATAQMELGADFAEQLWIVNKDPTGLGYFRLRIELVD